MRSPSRLRLHALALAVTVAVSAAGAARADSIDEKRHALRDRLSATRQRIEQARDREQTLADQISAQSDRIDQVESSVDDLSGQVAAADSRLEAARERLGVLERRLAEESRRLSRLRREVAAAQRMLAARLVEIYTSDRPELLAVALGAESLGSLIDQVEFYADLVESDVRLVDRVRAGRVAAARARATASRLRREQAGTTARLAREAGARREAYRALAAQRDSLVALRAERRRTLASVQVQRAEWEEEAKAIEIEGARLAAIIAAAPPSQPAEAAAGTGEQPQPPASSGFLWPVRGTITSPFGPRWGRLHAGIDIAAPGGTPIAASAAGTVVYSGSMSGYGNIVVVQHPNGIATAYAHNASNAVSVGQTVAQGQTIAYVGCTGICTGNHVHFEVRVNGTPVDPLGYL